MNSLRKTPAFFGTAVLVLSQALFAVTLTPHPGLFAPHPMPATQPQITFHVGVLSAGQNWAIVLEPDTLISGYTYAPGYVVPMDTTKPGIAAADQVGTLGAGYYVAKDGDFAFQNTQDLDRSVFVVSQVPPGKPVTVIQNGVLVFQANITAPILLVDGNVVADATCPRCYAVALLSMRPLIQQEFGPALQPDSDGEVVASTAALRRHLTHMPAVGAEFKGQTYPEADGRAVAVLAKIQIDATGKVASANLLRGTGPFAAAVTQALKGAQFKPFIYQGNPTPVSGLVQFTLWNNGETPQSNIGGE